MIAEGGFPTAIVMDAIDVKPAVSETVSSTVYLPASVYGIVGFGSVEDRPSPNFHKYVNESPSASVLLLPTKEIMSLT